MAFELPRCAGILIPLFSCPSSRSWGIGDIGDLVPISEWLAGAGQHVLQLLPLNEMAAGQASPYSAISAMAIDPVYIRVTEVAEFAAVGGESALGADDRATLSAVRVASHVDYASVRRLKEAALRAAFERFHAAEWTRDTPRAKEFAVFAAEQAWWLHDYAIFRALHEVEGPSWTEWPELLRRRDPAALEQARHEHAYQVLFYQYLQWLAATQWRAAREAAAARQVLIFGDLPFMVDRQSADVWTRQDDFDLDATVGVPPDAFSETGQDWGMPVYRWETVASGGFEWLRQRARRSADLYDGYRVDHLVGFYRTYSRPQGSGAPHFTPSEEHQQIELGERLLAIFQEPGSTIIAEDLGLIPDFVRVSLGRLGIPGFRVMRWERLWEQEGQPFRDPADYPPTSVATSGTHDTESLAVWWTMVTEDDRAKIGEVPTIRRIAGDADLRTAPYDPIVRDVLIEALFASGSNLVLLPWLDVFGWRDRVNEPATITDRNWTFRLPWPSDRLDTVAEARERQAALQHLTEAHGRLPASLVWSVR